MRGLFVSLPPKTEKAPDHDSKAEKGVVARLGTLLRVRVGCVPSRRRARLKRQGKPGVLGLLTLFFLASAGLRLFAEAEFPGSFQAIAEPDLRAEVASSNASDSQAMLAALAERDAQLKARATRLEERERAVLMAEERAAEMLAELSSAERALRETIALADGAAAADLDRLTRMYESMKPREAAALFETMDPNFAAGFIGKMRPASAAAILAGLTPETAYTVSLVLAGRNMQVPTE